MPRLAAAFAGLLAFAVSSYAESFEVAGKAGFSTVRVDVRPLLAEGGGLPAEALRSDLTEALQRSFADRLNGRGPSLVVRITGLTLAAYAGSQGDRHGFGGGSQSDYLDGEALLVGRRGEILARHPQLSALPASSGGAWYDPDSERRRLTALAEHYAQWLRRALPAE